jgi:hypothetical protein
MVDFMKSEILEHFGGGYHRQEPETVGACSGCGGEIYETEVATCENCDKQIHEGCKVKCAQCGHSGCKSCFVYDSELQEHFCDTAGPEDCRKPKAERLLISECRNDYLTGLNKETSK